MSEEIKAKKCEVCGKALPKIHIGNICIVCLHEIELEDAPDESYVRFNKTDKKWK